MGKNGPEGMFALSPFSPQEQTFAGLAGTVLGGGRNRGKSYFAGNRRATRWCYRQKTAAVEIQSVAFGWRRLSVDACFPTIHNQAARL
jgi:hypothetical protein